MKTLCRLAHTLLAISLMLLAISIFILLALAILDQLKLSAIAEVADFFTGPAVLLFTLAAIFFLLGYLIDSNVANETNIEEIKNEINDIKRYWEEE